MISKPALLFALTAAALAAPAFAEQQPIQTGYWEAKTVWLGLPGIEHWCIRPKDVSKFLSGPSNHIYQCTYPISTAADGHLHFEGTCVDKKGVKIKLHGQGEYTPTTVHMTAEGSTRLLGISVSAGATADARFISTTCPADAKAFS